MILNLFEISLWNRKITTTGRNATSFDCLSGFDITESRSRPPIIAVSIAYLQV